MPGHYYGFTNRILWQDMPKDVVNLFVPVYVILKIKNLQSVDVHSLTGSINSVIIIQILIEDLPEPLIHLLSTSIELQINRSELLFLHEDPEKNISLARTDKMLRFTIRRTLAATIFEETFWSPFEIIRLVVSLTFNSISKRDGTLLKMEYDKVEKEASTSFMLASQIA
jgi:hypothetical protein